MIFRCMARFDTNGDTYTSTTAYNANTSTEDSKANNAKADSTQGYREYQDPTELIEISEELEAQLPNFDTVTISDNKVNSDIGGDSNSDSNSDGSGDSDSSGDGGGNSSGNSSNGNSGGDSSNSNSSSDSSGGGDSNSNSNSNLAGLPRHLPAVRNLQSSQRPSRERKRRRDKDKYIYNQSKQDAPPSTSHAYEEEFFFS